MSATHFYIDSHVHLSESNSLDQTFDAAWLNFQKHSSTKQNSVFALFIVQSEKENTRNFLNKYSGGSWKIEKFQNDYLVTKDDQQLWLLMGQQLVTAEGLELLNLDAGNWIDYSPRQNIGSILNIENGLFVLPWGVGKWLFKRGKIVSDVVNKFVVSGKCLIGDIPMRIRLLNGNRHFSAESSSKTLRGTDPLPIDKSNESLRIGDYGTIITVSEELKPCPDVIRDVIRDFCNKNAKVSAVQFGVRLSLIETIAKQIKLRC